MRRPKKSKYKSVVINKKRYYYYKITWIDPTGDSGHATHFDSYSLTPSRMITHAYLFDKDPYWIGLTTSFVVILFALRALRGAQFQFEARAVLAV